MGVTDTASAFGRIMAYLRMFTQLRRIETMHGGLGIGLTLTALVGCTAAPSSNQRRSRSEAASSAFRSQPSTPMPRRGGGSRLRRARAVY
jgi:hypothetical protein